MHKQGFFLVTVLAMVSTAAMAAPPSHSPTHLPPGVVIGTGGGGAPVAFNLEHATAPGRGVAPAVESSAIINFFSRMRNAPYVSWSGQLVGCAFAGCYQEAMAFTAPLSTTSKKVTLGLMAWSADSYTYQADVSIYSDAAGVPGTALATDTVTAAPQFGPCCTPITAKLRVPLTAGTQYWIVVGPHTSTDALIWADQAVDYVNQYLLASSQNGGSWTAFTSTGYGYVLK
ncbi:MAG TPA: choice-of-anchor R domain-containing protein [Rhizomicrobium sp.]|nr:choice-of-anchor R domain-containing protein [Rhizomicrobium sp.]